MRQKLNYTIGLLFIITGLILKIIFNHNMNYWEFIKTSSILLFLIGLSLLIPFKLINQSKESKAKKKHFL